MSPGNAEVSDGVDNDCNGLVDEGTDFYDDDEDGYSEAEGDCDDTDPAAVPGVLEEEDGIDNDCDGLVDEGTDAYDDDGDGYSEDEGDCADQNPYVSPERPELCDGTWDDNCDGVIDEGCDEEETDEPEDAEGCACDQTSPAGPLSGLPLALLVLLGLHRRARRG